MSNEPQFLLTYKQIVAAIENYKGKVANGTYPQADWRHFCGTIGLDAESVTKETKQLRRKPSALRQSKLAILRHGKHFFSGKRV